MNLDQAVFELQQLLRIDTTNPPGNEAAAVELLARWLTEAGLRPVVLESAPGRKNLVCRVAGDGTKPPLLLAGHVDVVGVERAKWTHDPFAGEIHDGYLWGRGAVDMKNFLVMASQILRSYKGKRDLIFAAVADEEDGCDHGSRFLVEKHPELVRAEYMIGEVGGCAIYLGETTAYPVMVAEKGVAWLRAKFHGEPGHGSMPKPDTAILKLASFTEKLGRTLLPHHATGAARHMIQAMAEAQGGLARVVLPQLLNPRMANVVLTKLFPDKSLVPAMQALLRNTATPTIVGGGAKINQIPGEATLSIDGRTLPGFTADQLIAELEAHVGHGAQFEIVREMPPVETEAKSEVFDAISKVIATEDPGAVAIPYMVPGFTDAKQFSRLGIRCYGFVPLRYPREHKVVFGKLYHGHDERIWLDGFRWGTETLFKIVAELC